MFMESKFGTLIGLFEWEILLDEVMLMWVIFLICEDGSWVLAEGLTQANHLNEY